MKTEIDNKIKVYFIDIEYDLSFDGSRGGADLIEVSVPVTAKKIFQSIVKTFPAMKPKSGNAYQFRIKQITPLS